MLGLFFDRDRLSLLCLLLFLKHACCRCCFLCLPLLFFICFVLFSGENEPAVRVGYGIPYLLHLFLREIFFIAMIHIENF